MSIAMVGSKVFDPLIKGMLGLAKLVMSNPWVIALLAAGAAGYAAGTWLNNKFGNPNLGSLYYDRLHHADGSFRPWGFLSNETSAEANKRFAKEAIPPPNMQSVQVHTQINLDGRKVGEAVTHHQANEASKAFSGASSFDGRMMLAPVSFGGVW